MATTNDAMYTALKALYPTAGDTLGDLLYAHWSAVGGYGTSTTRTNLITNPNFEINTTGWESSGAAGSLTRSSLYAAFGTYSAQRICTGTGNANLQLNDAYDINGVAGNVFTFSSYVRSTVARSCRIVVNWYTAGNSFVSQSIGASTTSTTTSFTRVSVVGTVPSTATRGRIFCQALSVANGESHFWDAVLVETGSTLLPYFDGTYADTYTDYALTSQGWNGTAHGSASTAVWDWKPSLNLVNRGSLQYDYYVAQGAAGTTLGDLANSFWGDPDFAVSNLELEDGNDLLLENGDFMLLEVGNG